MSGFDRYESAVRAGASFRVRASVVVSPAHGAFTVKLRAINAVGNATAWGTTTLCLS